MNRKLSTLICLLLAIFAAPILAQEDNQSKTDGGVDVIAQLVEEQADLAERYKLLEDKLFKLYEYEQDKNPERSALLRQAFENSKKQFTAKQLGSIVQHLERKQLRIAQDRQKDAIAELVALLELLKSGDRSKRVRDKIKRFQQYLDEVGRIARIQQGIRGQAEGGVDPDRLENSQEKNADRTGNLDKDIESNESEGTDEGSSDESAPQPDEKLPDESQPGESQPGEQSDGDPSGKTPGANGSGESGQESESRSNENPVRKKLQAAESKMREAADKIRKAKRDESIDDMRQAERELAEAKRELEELLRQLREEEIGRSLAMLESRFRQMLEREIRVYETTKQLDQTPPELRRADFEIKSGKAAAEQRKIATEAGRALLLLKEDGSSIAFPETVAQMQEDMVQIGERLAAARVGAITQEIEQDVIESLDYLIEALVQAQRDLEDQSKQSQGGEGQAGDQPLVDMIAELKMIRGLQYRVNKRHDRYAKLLEDPDNPVGKTSDPELQKALQRLSERQDKLQRITQDIVLGKNR